MSRPRPVRRPGLRRGLALATLLAAVVVAVGFYSQGDFELDPQALRARIAALGWLAPLGFVAAAALRPFLALPSWVIMSVGGLLFGVVGGMVYGILGFTAGALLTFGIARGLGRDAVESRAQGIVARLDAYVRERGAKWLGLYTALPVTPLTPAHGTAGLSGMPLTVFTAAVVAGLVPRTALYSFFGDSLAEGDYGRIGVASAALVVTVGVGWLVHRWMRRAEVADAGR